MGYPHGYNGSAIGGQLWSTDTYQVAAFWKRNGTLRCGIRGKSGDPFRPTYSAWTYSDPPLGGLASLEIGGGDDIVEPDDHNSLETWVTDDGVWHVTGNMHDNNHRHIVGNFFTWSVAAAQPDEQVRNSYPMIRRTPNGLFYYMRSGPENVGGGPGDNRSGVGNSMYWTMPNAGGPFTTRGFPFLQGVNVPDGKGPGIPGDDFLVDTNFNWSFYPNFFVEPEDGPDTYPNPGRLWMAGVWRETGVPSVNMNPQVMYTDNVTDPSAWRAPNGSAVTLPLTPVNNTDCRLGWDRGEVGQGEYTNAGSVCINPNTGQPECILSRNPFYHFVYDDVTDTWSRTRLGSSAGFTIDGWLSGSQLIPYYVRGEFWALGNFTDSFGRHPRMMKMDGSMSVPMGGMTPYAAMGRGENFDVAGTGFELPFWEPQCDSEAWRKWQRIDVLTPNRNEAMVCSFGHQPERFIA